MKFLKSLLTGAALATAMTVASAPSYAQGVIKVGTFVPEQSVGVSKVIKPWMEAVQADVGDKVKLQGFWGGTLGKSPFKQFELVQNGVADATWVLPGYTAGQFPEMSLFELPFLFKTAEEASVVGWKLVDEGLLTGFTGVHVVGFFASEPNALFMRTKIESLEDLKGMKIRTPGPIAAQWLESLGAAPQVLSSAEMNEALNRGSIDGVIQGWTGMRTFKTFALVNQSYSVPAGVIPFLLLMNEKTWSGLEDSVKKSVMTHGGMAMAEAGAAGYHNLGGTIREGQKTEGKLLMSEMSEDKAMAYEKAAQSIADEWVEKTPNGKAVYDRTIALLTEMRK